MEKVDKLYEGKAKIIYGTSDPGMCIMYFKDEATAFDGKKRGIIGAKGACNAKISAVLFGLLTGAGISNHYVRTVSERELLVKRMEMFPIEFVIRNVVAGSLAKRLGLEEGFQLIEPILEYYYKRDDLGDPLLTESHLRVLGIVDESQFRTCSVLALQINRLLKNYFARKNLLLVDFKLEFGLDLDGGEILVGDEISPDTCRLWDSGTGEKLDKDRFRWDLGGVEEAYREVVVRLLGAEAN